MTKIFWGLALFGVISALITGCSGNNAANNKPLVDSNNNTVSYYTPRDTVIVGNFQYKVRGFGFNKTLGDNYFEKKADGIYLVVDLSLTNNDNQQHIIDNSLFQLTDTLGNSFDSSSDANTAIQLSGYKTLFMKECNPGILKHGYVCFEVPKIGVYDLHLSGGYWNGNTAAVRLVSNKKARLN